MQKELIMKSGLVQSPVEMNSLLDLMINEVKNLFGEQVNADKGYNKQHVQKWVDWSKNNRVK